MRSRLPIPLLIALALSFFAPDWLRIGLGADDVSTDFGIQLPQIGVLGIGGVMDCEVDKDRLFVIGHGKLCVADISIPTKPAPLATLTGLGNTRQIDICRDVAYITSREDGLFIVDVSRPESPRLLCHYDTIELATGIAVCDQVAFVACRTAGVELVDVSDPANPTHLSTVRTGEAQSVTARDGLLFAGVWGSRELVICDVADVYSPSVISRTPLDGNGDGVCLWDQYCFVATGHHARGWRRETGEASDEYGAGHGMEIFDITDPSQPKFCSRIKTRRFYRIGMDMWDVVVSGNHAFLGDTYNGVFVIDVTDVTAPDFIAFRQLPEVRRNIDGLDGGESLPGPVGGIAVAKDTLYVAGAWTDLHVLQADGATPPPGVPATSAPPPNAPRKTGRNQESALGKNLRSYRPEGQVYSVSMLDDTALVAAGAAGLHAVQLWPTIRKLAVFPTAGFARDVAVHGRKVYVAEANGGLSIWEPNDATVLRRIGLYRPKAGGVAQVVLSPQGKLALLHVGHNELQIVDVQNSAASKLIMSERHLGLFYTFPIARTFLNDRYACVLWHASGYRWYDLDGQTPPMRSAHHFAMRANFADGIGMLDDQAILVTRGKYALLQRTETRPVEELPFYEIPGVRLTGKPTLDGDTMYLSNRVLGTVQAVDISDLQHPRLLSQIQLNEHPGPVVVHKKVPVIPAGYQGLLVWDRNAK